MASTKEQMLKARELIKAKRYKEARAILRKINHPTAKEWLARIDSMGDAQASGKAKAASGKRGKKKATSDDESSGTSAGGLALRFLVLIIIIAVISVGYIALNSGNEDTNGGSDSNSTNNNTSTTGDNESAPPFVQGNNDAGSSSPFTNIGAPPTGGQIRFNDPVGGLTTLILPPGWSQQIAGIGVLSHMDYGDSIVVVSAAPISVTEGGQTLQDIATTLAASGGQDVAFNEYEQNSRTILQTTITTDDGQQADVYYVEDEDTGRVAVLLVQPQAQRSDALHNDVLQMAGTLKFG